jgi:spore coat polysaccharide biosynthesis protein SpsF
MEALRKPRVVASVEARMSSSRLPGKVLSDIEGRPALLRLLDRLQRATTLDAIVLATTVKPEDEALVRTVEAAGIRCYRGREEDVLNRVVEAHRMMGTELVVEVTGDCPLIDPAVIDLGVTTFLANDVDVVANVVKPSYPMGVDVQVFPFAALAEVEADVRDPAVREHVSLFFYDHPERYRILHLAAPERYRAPGLRLQLDYPEDQQLIREIYRRLEPKFGNAFGTPEILQLLAAEPALAEINRRCVEKAPR